MRTRNRTCGGGDAARGDTAFARRRRLRVVYLADVVAGCPAMLPLPLPDARSRRDQLRPVPVAVHHTERWWWWLMGVAAGDGLACDEPRPLRLYRRESDRNRRLGALSALPRCGWRCGCATRCPRPTRPRPRRCAPARTDVPLPIAPEDLAHASEDLSGARCVHRHRTHTRAVQMQVLYFYRSLPRAAPKLHKLLTSVYYQLSGYAIPASMKLL